MPRGGEAWGGCSLNDFSLPPHLDNLHSFKLRFPGHTSSVLSFSVTPERVKEAPSGMHSL